MPKVYSRIAYLAAFALSFAAFLALMLVLAGRLHAAGLTLALVAGSFVAAAIVAGQPVRALRAMSPATQITAAAGGVLAFFAAPAIVAGVRMSDSPAGAVVVFWIAGGWAAVAGAISAGIAWRSRRWSATAVALAGAATALAGVAAVVSNWERPSSFSPLVRFPVQEASILIAGCLFVGGGLLLAAARQRGGLPGTLVAASGAAGIVGLAWFLLSDPAAALASIGELSVQTALAALAWGAVCALLPSVIDKAGISPLGACIVVAPALISALTWVEQAVGVSGPQPFVIGGVVAGAAVVALAATALALARLQTAPAARPVWAVALAVVPLVAACVALFVPALTAFVNVDSDPTFFKGSWSMPGMESVAGWVAAALAVALVAAVLVRRSRLLPLVGILASMAWFMLRDVPTHVLNNWLSPAVQSYYGTEYGSISFTAVANAPMLFAVVASGTGFAALAILNFLPSKREGAAAAQHRTPEV